MPSRYGTERHILFGLFLAFAAFVLCLLVTFSTPFIKPIFFLRQNTIRYGLYGWCDDTTGYCLRRYGYAWDDKLVEWLLKGSQVLVPIATAFALLGVVALLLDVCCQSSYSMTNPAWFRIAAVFASLSSILGAAANLALWYIARIRFDDDGVRAKYGPAPWMLLSGAIAAALSLCVGGPRYTGQRLYRADNRTAYNV